MCRSITEAGLMDLNALEAGTNTTLSCPAAFHAIGYTAAAYAYGIDYLDVSPNLEPSTRRLLFIHG